MKYYFIYLKCLVKYRKEIRNSRRHIIKSSPEMQEIIYKNLRKDFEEHMDYNPIIKITKESMDDYIGREKPTIINVDGNLNIKLNE